MYRNPAPHDPRLSRLVGDEELLELLTTLSMVHRRLDAARTQPWPSAAALLSAVGVVRLPGVFDGQQWPHLDYL